MLEGASLANETTFPIHGYNDANYTYEARGNLKTRPVQLTTGGFAIPGQTLTWDVENRLVTVSGTSINNTAITESYLYDENGIRIKKTSNGVNTFTPFAHYEVDNGTTVKYYTFNGLRVAMRRGSTLYYLHGDHLGSTALTTTGSGTGVSQTYCAYGKTRSGATCASGNSLATDRQFTGQQ